MTNLRCSCVVKGRDADDESVGATSCQGYSI